MGSRQQQNRMCGRPNQIKTLLQQAGFFFRLLFFSSVYHKGAVQHLGQLSACCILNYASLKHAGIACKFCVFQYLFRFFFCGKISRSTSQEALLSSYSQQQVSSHRLYEDDDVAMLDVQEGSIEDGELTFVQHVVDKM